MRKAQVQMTLKKGADEEEAGGMAPPSPRIPSKRAKVSSDHVVPDPAASVYPTPTPPVFIRKMRNAAVGTGCDIRLKVAVAGDPQPTLYWYHNDDLLNMDNQEYGGLVDQGLQTQWCWPLYLHRQQPSWRGQKQCCPCRFGFGWR